MAIIVIKEGDKHEQGNAKCPQCNEQVLIEQHWGNPPNCPHCRVPYSPIIRPAKYS